MCDSDNQSKSFFEKHLAQMKGSLFAQPYIFNEDVKSLFEAVVNRQNSNSRSGSEVQE